jgi:hypothetical protein
VECRDIAEWNKYFIPLFGYFKKEKNKYFIPSYSIPFNYYFSDPNNRTLFIFYFAPLHSIIFYQLKRSLLKIDNLVEKIC